MAFKTGSVFLLIALLYAQGGQSWTSWYINPWINAYQSLKFERQQIAMSIGSINQQTGMEISSVIIPINWKLNAIQNAAKEIPSACAQKILADIDVFYSTMNLIHKCRNNAQIGFLKEQQMRKIDAGFQQVKQAEITCRTEVNFQERSDKVTKEIQDKLEEIRHETQTEVDKITKENYACVKQKGNELVAKSEEIEDNWSKC